MAAWEQARYQLASSDCEPLSLKDLLAHADDECLARWESLSLGYPESTQGDAALLQEIAGGLYHGALEPEHILGVVPAEGILLALHSLLSPGDHVVTTSPAYASLHLVASEALGCEVTPWPVEWDETGHPTFSLDTLRSCLRPQTRVLVVNFPHNPTGYLPTLQEWEDLVSLCADRGLYLFSDEMYRHLERPSRPALPSAAESYALGVTLSGLSKAYGLAGLRLGWLASQDLGVIRRASELKDYTTICAGTPNECLGLMALRQRERLWERARTIIRDNIALMDDFAAERQAVLDWRPPFAGPVAFPKLLQGQDAAAHCEALLDQERVMLISERSFGDGKANSRVRVGLGRRGMEEMLARWGRQLDRSL